MANPVVYYSGQDITCYPGSNQTDDGKLNLEFNMARIVTRLSSKNFCIVKPSFELTLVTDNSTGLQYIKVGTGQCSINGMDLIMTSELNIDPPETVGHHYLAFHLRRDSSENVLSDLVVGVTRTFQGVYLTYYDEKPDPVTDADIFYLGSLDWDGKTITNLEEDEDKYGRIWAEDVLGKFQDPKHPDITRLNLQEFIYNLPDWYFSKEGDTIYGPLIVADSDVKNNPGVIINTDENGSHITIKDPAVDNDKLIFYGDLNQDGVIDEKDVEILQQFLDGTLELSDLQKVLGDVNHDELVDEKDLEYIQNFLSGEGNAGDTGNIYYIFNTDHGINFDVEDGTSKIEIGKGSITESETDDILHIHNNGGMCLDAEGEMTVQADGKIDIATEGQNTPHLTLEDNKISINKPSSDLEFNVSYPTNNTIRQVLGKAIWQYDNTTQNVTLLQDNVKYLDIVPNGVFEQDLTVQDDLFLGPLGQTYTYLRQNRWQLSDNKNKQIQFTPSSIVMNNKSLSSTDNSYILLKNDSNNIHTQIYDDAKIELLNPTRPATILWKDGNATYDVTLHKIIGEKRLNLDGNLSVANNIVASGSITGNGLTTTNGTITFQRGSNNATITKDNNSTNLRTSGNLYVGPAGQNNLYAGNTVVNGSFAVGGNTYDNSEFKVDASGNLNTTGIINASRVLNAVYNDLAEYMEKEDYNEVIEPGDIVCFTDNGKVTKIKNTEDTLRVAGVVSSLDTAGQILGGDGLKENEKCLIALAGRVYVKVNCPVRTGNLLRVMNDGTVSVTNILDRFVIGKATKPSENGIVYMKVIN